MNSNATSNTTTKKAQAPSAHNALLALLSPPEPHSTALWSADPYQVLAMTNAPSPALSPDWALSDSFDAALNSFSPNNFQFGTPFDAASMYVDPALSLFGSAGPFNNVPSKASHGSSSLSTPGDDFLSAWGTPAASASVDVAATWSSSSSVAAGNNVSPLADAGSANFSSAPSDFDFLSSLGTPFPALMDVASASSGVSAVAGNNVLASLAGDGFSSNLSWLDQFAPSSVSASPAPVKAPSSGNRVTAVSSSFESRVSGIKQTVEHPAFCKVCNAAVATMILRGHVDSFVSSYLIDVTCDSCATLVSPCSSPSSSPSPDATSLKIVQSRKRARKVNEDGKAVHCDVCHKHVASGGVQVSSEDSSKRHCTGTILKGRKDAFSVEVVCADCRSCFGFCTECGGGGKYRTGKYRPFELFQDGRRTCNLPHFRLGDTKATHTVVSASADSLAAAKTLFVDAFMSLHATPKQMCAVGSAYSSVAAIQQAAEQSWNAEQSRIVSSLSAQYVAFASIPKSSRKKARATAPSTSDSAEVQMAFLTAESSNGVLEVKQVASKVSASQNASLIVDMVRNTLGALPAGSVQHVLVSSSMLSPAQCEKLGVVSVDTYLSKMPVNASSFYVRQRALDELLGGKGELFVAAAASVF
ncbi:hypothetical protein BJ741DRAFT_661845 [Chytriomyces cf. hyalinus JEL632]|nr:hypothetical protein BJ741DRAFT_661845 [Chytriomyces cf. hyalinus JEL632]